LHLDSHLRVLLIDHILLTMLRNLNYSRVRMRLAHNYNAKDDAPESLDRNEDPSRQDKFSCTF
jgi:hypothetical protein